MPDFQVVSSVQFNRRRGLFALETAQAIMMALTKDPLSIGEELYRLKNMRLDVRIVVRHPWSIHLGVDVERHIVYLQGHQASARSVTAQNSSMARDLQRIIR